MIFDSAIYILFLALVTAVYWRLGHKNQNRVLLLASYVFYGWWDWRFLGLMAVSTVVDYYVARGIRAQDNLRRRKLLLTTSLVLNFTFLGFFKYFGFFLDSFARMADLLGLHNIPHSLWAIILPPAISFYTFQEVAYIVDVYFRKLEPADSLLEYAVFISLFPHLIAGPIQRPAHLLPQVQHERRFSSKKFYDGCMLILLGLFRKCVIADSCAQIANAAFAHNVRNGWELLLGMYAFAFQIYADFSGYSDMARGSAQLLGFHFMVNFRQPYLATSLQDFWRRWHISLSTWLRDYLYIPLGGNRKGNVRTYLNLMVTMLLGGLWHGASFNFVIWGGLHGGGLAVERFFGLAEGQAERWKWIRRIVVFHIVCLAWIFFRASSLHEAFRMVSGVSYWQWTSSYTTAFLYLLAILIPIWCIDLYAEHRQEEYPTQKASLGWQLSAATAAIVFTAFGAAYQSAPFVYFQF